MPPSPYVPDTGIVEHPDTVDVDMTTGATLLSADQINLLIAFNADKPVVLTGNGYTITFPKGTMTGTGGELNFGVRFNSGAGYAFIQSEIGSKLVLMLEFVHSGALPGEAQICIYVGTQYIGQTMEYLYYNTVSGKLQCVQTAVVDAKGCITVTQDHCSSYGVARLQSDDVPKTGDSSLVLVWWVLAGIFATGLLIVILWSVQKEYACNINHETSR